MSSISNWKRNFALFIIGQGLTLFGSMLVYYAVLWHITLQTQSGLMMTLVVAAGALPMFFISPFAGVWADRYNKKLLINIADATVAAVTLVMAVIFSLGIDLTGVLLMCLVMRALGQGVQMPAVNALIPELVPKEHLTRVNGISGSVQSIVMFASPMAGGALLTSWPPPSRR
jgi:DHA3 family macrolide efflux protein-like MFS transporter